jgi:hypothetical protein
VCGLLLAARRYLLLASLISVLAIEVQPIGIMAPIYLIACELSRMIQERRFRVEFDRVGKLVLGGVLGLLLMQVAVMVIPMLLLVLAARNTRPIVPLVDASVFLAARRRYQSNNATPWRNAD